MADNFSITPGTGITIGSDEDGGVHYQRVKCVSGNSADTPHDVGSDYPMAVQLWNVSDVFVNLVKNLSVGTSINTIGGVVRVQWGIAFNANASTRYLKLWNRASAPTLGTHAPDLTIPLETGKATYFNANTIGITFLLGFHYAATTGLADADTGAPSANDVVFNFAYQGV